MKTKQVWPSREVVEGRFVSITEETALVCILFVSFFLFLSAASCC
jgi:hypothetical protein